MSEVDKCFVCGTIELSVVFERGVCMKKMNYLLAFVMMIIASILTFGTAASAYSGISGTLPTGDGRIYTAIGVLAVAIIVVVLMIIFRKKDNDE